MLKPQDIRDNYVLFHIPSIFGRELKMYEHEMVRYTVNQELNAFWHQNTIQVELDDFYFENYLKNYSRGIGDV